MRKFLSAVKEIIEGSKRRREKLFKLMSPFMIDDFIHGSKISEIVKGTDIYDDFFDNMLYSPTLEKDLGELYRNGYIEKSPYLSFDLCECCTHGFRGGAPAYKLSMLGKGKFNELTNNQT